MNWNNYGSNDVQMYVVSWTNYENINVQMWVVSLDNNATIMFKCR